jgi:hypothetical protein
MSGMLPLALRKLGDKIWVVGALPDYTAGIPAGSELLMIDGVPATALYAQRYETVSTPTPWFQDYVAGLLMEVGPIGDLRHVTLRTPKGATIDAALPMMSRQLFDKELPGNRPKSGTEVAPSIFYANPASLDRATRDTLIRSASRGRAVILDLRGEVNSETYELVAHFLTHAISSPKFEIPIVSAKRERSMTENTWQVFPAVPRLDCRLIVLTDARAISAVETMLQILRDNHLATFVGEPSAGTNGNVNTFIVPGDFEIRFTGMRVAAPDGSTIQGHGITPDRVVHPTVDGIRGGRDEILEAGIAEAQRSVAP